MIQIGDKIVSRDLFEIHFACHLEKCMGRCCVIGESGAPLEDEEGELIEEHLQQIKEFMGERGIKAAEEQGAWIIDGDGDRVTPLIGGEECAFAVFEKGIARCSIENAFREGAIPFGKPLSCHLYPLRINRLRQGIALNYHQWDICGPARIQGRRKGMPVFRFIGEAIIRRFGEAFYKEMEEVYKEICKFPDNQAGSGS